MLNTNTHHNTPAIPAHTNANPITLATACATALAAIAPAATAQVTEDGFGTPGTTSVQQRISGDIVLADNAPTPETGDQIAAFFNDQLVGLDNLATGSLDFSFIISGDDPLTDQVEGPAPGESVDDFRFFDASTNTVITDITPLNDDGEPFNYVFDGLDLGDIPPGGFPIDIVPTQTLDLQLGSDTTTGDGDGDDADDNDGDSPTETPGNPDVDGNGKVNVKDAAIILRFVSGSSSAGVSASAADVNGDGAVDVDDAIAVLRARND